MTESGSGETFPTWGTRTEALDVVTRSGDHEIVTIARTSKAAKASKAADHHTRDLLGFLLISHSIEEAPIPNKKKCDHSFWADVIKVMPGEKSTYDMNADRAKPVHPGRESDDVQRFTTLYRRHHSDVRGFARRRVGSDAWRRIEAIPDAVVPWLYRVALYEIANLRRRQAKRVKLDDALHQGDPHIELGADTDASDLLHAIAGAFGALKPRDQEILRLAAWEQVTMAEGAAILGCSLSAYRMRLHRARSRLAAKSGARDFGREPRPDASESAIVLARALARNPLPMEGTELAI
jgi:RNA polymerase sigma-70 factor, ECF subfamily